MADPAASPLSPARWQLQSLLAQPWRLGFAAGATLLALAGAWWIAVLVPGAVPRWAVPRPLAHGAVMALGPFPLFIGGFAFTALPRWLRVPAPPTASLLPAFGAQAIGWCVWLAGTLVAPAFAAVGAAIAAAGLADLARRAVRQVRASDKPDRLHPALIAAALAAGAVATAVLAAATALQRWDVAGAAVLTGFWGCVAAVFTVAADRLVPAFDLPGASRRAHALLAVVLAAVVLRAIAPWMGEHVAWLGLLAAVQGAAGLAIAAGAFAWQRARHLRTPLVRALFLGSCWFAAGWLLGAFNAASRAAGHAAPLPLADVHALGAGAFSLLLAGMASQVVAAHTARPLVLGARPAWLFAAVQGAVLLRIAAAAFALPFLLLPAAVLWSASLGAWAFRIVHEAALATTARARH
ncbi:NnrS family protein [Ramlibacter algicola]|uniref:NnrS family protein n=1 Tax=Ramlibacter algicola TaxID=2795217 RepID=A0A934Q1J5_9BURK|nr:NnrS family protein [Ramlibacter algicola]